jgi:hypothetical protein
MASLPIFVAPYLGTGSSKSVDCVAAAVLFYASCTTSDECKFHVRDVVCFGYSHVAGAMVGTLDCWTVVGSNVCPDDAACLVNMNYDASVVITNTKKLVKLGNFC